MSTCPDSDLWSALVDGEVPSPWKEKMETHLASCAECRKRVERYRKIGGFIAAEIHPLAKERLEESYARLCARRERIVSRRKAVEPATPETWIHSSIRLSLPAFAAVLAAAVFLPTALILATVSRVQSQQSQYVAMIPAIQNGPVDIDSSVKALATSNQVYRPDLPAHTVSAGYLSQARQMFSMLNFAKQYTDKEAFSDSDIIIIKMPGITRFSNTGTLPFHDSIPLQANAGFMR